MVEERVAPVTGAARGIGAGIAARLLADGWRVVGADRSTFPAAGVRAVTADVSEEAEVGALVEGVREREGRLDALVSNAGFTVRKPVGALLRRWWPG